jgi:L-seryl-tRNA(Ser) seleniumtransferase
MKTGKEEIVGLLAAIERYLALDHTARADQFEQIVAGWIARLEATPGVTVWRDFPNEAGQPIPRAALRLDAAVAGVSSADLVEQLWHGEPRIAVDTEPPDLVYLTPDTLEPAEAATVAARIATLLAG